MSAKKKSGRPAPEDDCEGESLGDDYQVVRLAVSDRKRVPARVMIGGHDVLIGFYDTQADAVAAIREAQARLKP